MPSAERVWGASLHQSFRLFPTQSPNLEAFLSSDGKTPAEVLSALPFDAARSRSSTGVPDAKRYRDGRHVYQWAGLFYEHEGIAHVTDLGATTRRWVGDLSEGNAPVLGRHAAYALAACQLRNPTGAGRKFADDMEVFPFAFIWKAMLALEHRISSDELNRVIFRVTSRDDLEEGIDLIRRTRVESPDQPPAREETISEQAKNDRIISWIALASFGWLLLRDKSETGGKWYEIRPNMIDLLREASQMERSHREFESVADYVRSISDAACLPEDVR